MKKHLLSAILILFFSPLESQNIQGIVNDYYSVSAIYKCNKMISFSSAHNFVKGDSFLIIQMKGASMETANNSSYGNITAINGAGLYEINAVDSVINSTTILIKYKLANNYNLSHLVQVVRIPKYQKAVVSGKLTCKAWDGSSGGVLALIADTLNINDSISVKGKGFRGAGVINMGSNCSIFPISNFAYSVANSLSGRKGEGISLNNTGANECGKGKNINGGGGGNEHNAGGGGGSNGNTGGAGGKRWRTAFSCPGLHPGLGGISLVNQYNNRLFLGGGGGAGHENNNHTNPGGNGGGIVLLIANYISGNNAIDVSGDSVAPLFDGDGGSGGGAGGTVMLWTNTSNINGNITILANGGKGQTVDNALQDYCCGAGGGGSGGIVFLKGTSTPGALTIVKNGGLAGASINSTINCSSYIAENGLEGNVFYTNTNPASNVVFSNAPFNPVAFNVGKDTSICKGQSISFTANQGSNIHWTPNVFLNKDTGTVVIATPDSTTTYYITALDSCLNKVFDTVTLFVNAIALQATPDTIICLGDSVNLSVAMGKNIQWSPATFLNKDTGMLVTCKPNANITYFLSAQDNCLNQTYYDTVRVTVLPKIGLINYADSTLCKGDSAVLALSHAKNVLWTPATYLSRDTGLAVSAKPLVTTTYYVQAKENCSQKSFTDSVTYYVIQPTSVSFTKDSLKLGDSILIKAINKTKFMLGQISFTDSIFFKPDKNFKNPVCIVGTEKQCTDTFCFNIKLTVVEPNVIGDISNNTILVYPNPVTNNILHIDLLNGEKYQVNLLDMQGKKYLNKKLTDKNNTLLLEIPAGVYLLNLEHEKTKYSFKIIKQ